jgi:hypothetical protein
MSEDLTGKLEQLVNQGTQLVPLGGFEFSGYNARLQNKYLEWRKSCLEALEQVGPIGFPYKSKILGDANGGYFFQASTQLILNCVKELHEKLVSSPDLGAQAAAAAPPAAQAASAAATSSAGRVIKPPPKPSAPAPPPPVSAPAAASPAPAPAAQAATNKVFVVGEVNDGLRQELSTLLSEIGVEEVPINRVHGTMIALDQFDEHKDVRYAFFVFNSDDLSYAMFEIGHIAGKLGKGRVTVLVMSDVAFPKTVPGVNVKPITVKLEEATLGIIKELKAAGVTIEF